MKRIRRGSGADWERLTVRLPAPLIVRATIVAAAEGMATNTLVVRAVHAYVVGRVRPHQERLCRPG